MKRRTVYIAPRVATYNEDWLFGMSAEAFRAWHFLQVYVKVHAPSQKDPGRAVRLGRKRAAGMWGVSEAAIEEMEQAAVKGDPDSGPQLRIEDGCWVVLDKGIFQSEKTIARHAGTNGDEDPQATPVEDGGGHEESEATFVGQTTPNEDTDGQTEFSCHATGSGSGSGSGSEPDGGGDAGAGAHERVREAPGPALLVAEPKPVYEPDPPPWWAEQPDSLLGWIGLTIDSVPKYARCSRPATRERTEDLLLRLLKAAPSEAVIRDFVTEWAEFHCDDGKGRFGKDDPISSLRNRIAQFEPGWGAIRRRSAKGRGEAVFDVDENGEDVFTRGARLHAAAAGGRA